MMPPSTTSRWPVTKLAASDARNTAAPANSSSWPNRFIGVRSKNSCPRAVPSSRAAFKSVRNTPGTSALTQTPDVAHSIARVFEGSNARFAGAIRGNFMEPNKRRKRADIDDAAIALLDHVPAEDAASAQSSLQICFEDGIPLGFRKIERRHSFRASGTIHQDLDAAELIAY